MTQRRVNRGAVLKCYQLLGMVDGDCAIVELRQVGEEEHGKSTNFFFCPIDYKFSCLW